MTLLNHVVNRCNRFHMQYATCTDMIARVSLTRWSIFLFLDVPNHKLKIIIIIILTTDRHEVILPTDRKKKKLSYLYLIRESISVNVIFKSLHLYSINEFYKMWILLRKKKIYHQERCPFLTFFMPLVFFNTPWKHQKTTGLFSGGKKKDGWHDIG